MEAGDARENFLLLYETHIKPRQIRESNIKKKFEVQVVYWISSCLWTVCMDR